MSTAELRGIKGEITQESVQTSYTSYLTHTDSGRVGAIMTPHAVVGVYYERGGMDPAYLHMAVTRDGRMYSLRRQGKDAAGLTQRGLSMLASRFARAVAEEAEND
jgi:hypothetical protein